MTSDRDALSVVMRLRACPEDGDIKVVDEPFGNETCSRPERTPVASVTASIERDDDDSLTRESACQGAHDAAVSPDSV
jgi:hypothetical protein